MLSEKVNPTKDVWPPSSGITQDTTYDWTSKGISNAKPETQMMKRTQQYFQYST